MNVYYCLPVPRQLREEGYNTQVFSVLPLMIVVLVQENRLKDLHSWFECPFCVHLPKFLTRNLWPTTNNLYILFKLLIYLLVCVWGGAGISCPLLPTPQPSPLSLREENSSHITTAYTNETQATFPPHWYFINTICCCVVKLKTQAIEHQTVC